MISDMLFNDWSSIARVFIVGVLSYIALVALLRTSGKRTLTKLNAFDLVVTVALGSILATILLSKDVALAEGIMAFITLIGLQFVVAWLSVRFAPVRRIVKSEPAMLLYRGEFLHDAMQRERVAKDEILAAVRSHQMADFAQVEAVVLETDGSMSVIKNAAQSSDSTLVNVTGMPGQPEE